MRIALIGCTSLLAGYITPRLLLEPDVKLALFGRRLPSGDLFADRIKFHLFNFPDMPLNFFELSEYDAIVYCAASGVQANYEDSRYVTEQLNYSIPSHLLTYLMKSNYQGKWVSFGTYFEIGESTKQHKFSEEDVLHSVSAVPNIYCESKRKLTAFIESTLPLTFPAWHLILPTIYGANEHRDRLIPYLVRTLKSKQQPKLSTGTQVRQYVHCQDVADLVALALMHGIPNGIYNVAGPDVLSIKSIVELVFSLFDQSADLAFGTGQTRDESMPCLQLSGRKLEQVLPAWRPRHSLATSMAEYLK